MGHSTGVEGPHPSVKRHSRGQQEYGDQDFDNILIDFGVNLDLFRVSLAALAVLIVPRALLVRMDWSTVKNKPSGPMSDHFWTSFGYFDIISMLCAVLCSPVEGCRLLVVQ